MALHEAPRAHDGRRRAECDWIHSEIYEAFVRPLQYLAHFLVAEDENQVAPVGVTITHLHAFLKFRIKGEKEIKVRSSPAVGPVRIPEFEGGWVRMLEMTGTFHLSAEKLVVADNREINTRLLSATRIATIRVVSGSWAEQPA